MLPKSGYNFLQSDKKRHKKATKTLLSRFRKLISSANLPCMDYLWTPWRYAYVYIARKSDRGCVFCDAAQGGGRLKVLIVYRGQYCYVILNAFPYTPGHVMIVPYAHLDELRRLPGRSCSGNDDAFPEDGSFLRELYHPDGINLGMNIGKAAGAGIAGHIHMHVLPRWVADANFVVGYRRDAGAAGNAGCDLGEDERGAERA